MKELMKSCIDACLSCAAQCTSCAVSCLEEAEVHHLTECIRLDIECATVCKAAADLMGMNSSFSREICKLCADVCMKCADECSKHQHMEHCRECAEVCRSCASKCHEMSSASTKIGIR
jgi:hypothetical protein